MNSNRVSELDRRRFLQAAAAAGVSAPLAGSAAWAQSKDPLKIGVTMPLTGSQAGYGNDFIIGMRQALKDLNDAGGVAGRPLELVVLDTQAEPALGINAMNKLINVDKAPIILTAWSAVVKAQAPTANREKVLLLNTGANAPEIAHLGEFVYTTFPLADVDITALAKYTYGTLGKRKAAVLYINNDTGIDAAKIYKEVFEKAGGQVVTYEAYDPKATEFSGMLLKLRAAEPGHGPHSRSADGPADGDGADASARPAAADLELFRRLQSETVGPARTGGGGFHRHVAGARRGRQLQRSGLPGPLDEGAEPASQRLALHSVSIRCGTHRRAPLQAHSGEEPAGDRRDDARGAARGQRVRLADDRQDRDRRASREKAGLSVDRRQRQVQALWPSWTRRTFADSRKPKAEREDD